MFVYLLTFTVPISAYEIVTHSVLICPNQYWV